MSFPQEMTALPNWVCWGKAGDNDRKKPWNPVTGYGASASDPTTWATYQQAVEAVRRGEYAGVGFEFRGSGLVGIDFDHCMNRESGEIIPQVLAWLQKLDSYTEVSQSGHGFHVIVKGKKHEQIAGAPNNKIPVPEWGQGFDGTSNEHGQPSEAAVEMYDDARYFALTETQFSNDSAVNARQDVADALFVEVSNMFLKRKGQRRQGAQASTGGGFLTDSQILALARNSSTGSRFRQLYDTGQWEGIFGSQSSADQSLCNDLAFYSTDFDQVDRLFRQSALMRDKWDEKHYADGRTYGQATVQKALADTVTHYQGSPSAPVNLPDKAPGEFPELRRFEDDESQQLPAFPVDCLPDVLRKYAVAAAENIQVPVEMVALPCICALATCVQGKFEVHIKPGWHEPLCLFVLVVAAPSERKSSALRKATDPIGKYVGEYNASIRAEVEAYKAKIKVLEKRKNRLIEEEAKTSASPSADEPLPETSEELPQESALIRTIRELEELESRPVNFMQLVANNVTPEKLETLMMENHGCMSIFSAEGGIFGIMAGLYNNGKANTDVFTQGFSGDRIQADRLTRGRVEIERPALTMCLLVQPEILAEVKGNKHIKGVGVLARFLFAFPEKKQEREYETPEIPFGVYREYHELIRKLISLYDYPEAGQNPPYICFSPEAHELSKAFARELERRYRPEDSELRTVEEWAGKIHGTTCRLAALFHIANNPDDPAASTVSGDEFAAAQQLTEQFFIPHAVAAFRSSGAAESGAVYDAKYIWARIEAAGLKACFKKNEIFHLCARTRFPAVKDMESGLSELQNRGYIQIEKSRAGGKGGRPSDIVKVNPELLEGV